MSNKGKYLSSKDDLYELVKSDGGRFKVDSLSQAYNFCKKITFGHYENFPVASLIFPKSFRHHVFPIYAFARIADDIADELTEVTIEDRLSALSQFEENLFNDYVINAKSGNPILLALHDTMKRFEIPPSPFQKLLIAFSSDIKFQQPKNLIDLEDYCSNSANPVGELILRLSGIYNFEIAKFSDAVCTGLQLVNFWQDLSRDLKINRFYVPEDIMNKYSLNQQNLFVENKAGDIVKCLNELYELTEHYFDIGDNLIKHLNSFRLKLEIKATIEGGRKILQKVKNSGINILYNRPQLSKLNMSSIFLKVLLK